MGPPERSPRSSSRTTKPLMPMPEEQLACLARAARAPRCGAPAARAARWRRAISKPARTEGSRRLPQGQLTSSHRCIAPLSRATSSGRGGGLDAHAWSTSVSCCCASARDSRWNIGSGDISPIPATGAVPPRRAWMMTRRPQRTNMGFPRLRRRGAFSVSSMGSDQAANICRLSAAGATLGVKATPRSCLLTSQHSPATSSGHSSTSACPTLGTAVTTPCRSSSPTAANFLSSAP
mmetsp:Transcript_52613/g.156905  ORF Transcript_52613/g.156905 Transcript_52613/m.156905 type:complete len:235 (+) Transcript_52613:1087-1791(+)